MRVALLGGGKLKVRNYEYGDGENSSDLKRALALVRRGRPTPNSADARGVITNHLHRPEKFKGGGVDLVILIGVKISGRKPHLAAGSVDTDLTSRSASQRSLLDGGCY